MPEDTIKPSEWQKLFEWVQTLIGHTIPPYIAVPLGYAILAALILIVILVIFTTTLKIKENYDKSLGHWLYSTEVKQKTKIRQRFAKYLLQEIISRNLTENWRDEEFTELEAEVEAEGSQRTGFLKLKGWQSGNAIHRERSLSVALERSLERLILVEGDPGVGKSIALRHVAHRMADAATSSSQSDRKLPVYINLKELKRPPGKPVDHRLIRALILESMNRVNDKFIDEFLLSEFDEGIKNGLWVFLFNSFDEIPDILSSTEQDEVISNYTKAISDFLSGINDCRGIVASRNYRGPLRQGWRTFRLLELSRPRQRLLMQRALPLKPHVAAQLEVDLLSAPDDVQVMARNPMLLQLLCDHVGEGHGFPSSAHDIFAKYLQHRFTRDEDRIQTKFRFDGPELRLVAEQVAFAMMADSTLGLSPLRATLPSALTAQGFRISRDALFRALDAMEYMKIARSDLMSAASTDRQFTFSHRRFQEYFATCVVVRESSRVPAEILIADARWRETAVALCQTGKPAEVQSLIGAVTRVVERAATMVMAPPQLLASSANPPATFDWPRGLLHVLGILQAGFVSGQAIPEPLREQAGELLVTISRGRDLLDQKLALEVAGVADQRSLLTMVRDALSKDSQWLNDTAYKQIARLTSLPDDISVWVRSALLRLAANGQLVRNQTSINAHLSRLPNSGLQLKSAARLATWIWPVDLVLYSLCTVLFGLIALHRPMSYAPVIGVAAALTSFLWRKLYLTRWGSVIVMIRMFIAVEFAVVIAILSDYQYETTLASIAFFYGSIWAIAAAACVRKGTITSIILWPLAPVFATAGGMQAFLQALRTLNVLSIKIFFFILVAYAVLGAIFYWFFDTITSYFSMEKNILFTVLGAFGAYYVGLKLLGYFRDSAKLVGWLRTSNGEIDGTSLAAYLRELRSGQCRLRLISTVRSRDILTDDETGQKALRDLARQFEQPLASPLTGTTRVLFLLTYLPSAVFFPEYRAECRDEIYMLLERRIGAQARSQPPAAALRTGGAISDTDTAR